MIRYYTILHMLAIRSAPRRVVARDEAGGVGSACGLGCGKDAAVLRGGGNWVSGGSVGKPSGRGMPSFVVPMPPVSPTRTMCGVTVTTSSLRDRLMF